MKQYKLVTLFCFTGLLQLNAQTNTATEQTAIVTNQTMPSVLLSFDAIINDKKVELTWSSNTEQNNNYFTIERSKDALAFEEVTTIKNFGNNSNIVNYFDVDYLPYEGISYYRLKQTDAKGNVLSSRIVSVNYGFSNDGSSVYQNTGDETASTLLGSENKDILVVLRNEKGQESVSKVKIDTNNEVIVSANSESKPNTGTYLIVASSDNKLHSRKITVK